MIPSLLKILPKVDDHQFLCEFLFQTSLRFLLSAHKIILIQPFSVRGLHLAQVLGSFSMTVKDLKEYLIALKRDTENGMVCKLCFVYVGLWASLNFYL